MPQSALVFAATIAVVSFSNLASAAIIDRPFSRLDPDWAAVSTLAGSGRSGTADGPAAASEFIEPYGIAANARGDIFVADRYGQRIKEITRDGIVTTIAGGGKPNAAGLAVSPGFIDGPGAVARFNRPTALAIGSDGTVYVADEGNGAVRAIRSGVVSTYVTMHRPISLALDAHGNLYVADYPDLEKVAPDGTITPIPLKVPGPVLSVTATVADHGATIIAATANRFVVIDALSDTIKSTHPIDATESGEVPGRIGQIAAFDERTVVFSDTLDQSVRLRTITMSDYTRPIAGDPLQRSYSHGGGYRDGPGQQALFADPMGLAILRDGTIAVADAANRRIRKLGSFDADTPERESDLQLEYPASPPAAGEYRIIFFGDSYTWTNLAWHESIPGRVDDGLRAAQNLCGHRPIVYVVRRPGLLPQPAFDLVDNILGTGIANLIILALPEGGDSETQIADRIRTSTKLLSQTGTLFMPISFPESWDVASAAESYDEYHYDLGIHDREYDFTQRAAENHALSVAGDRALNIWPEFLAAESSAVHQPLYESGDVHFTPIGAKLVADAILRKLVHDHPWGTCSK